MWVGHGGGWGGMHPGRVRSLAGSAWGMSVVGRGPTSASQPNPPTRAHLRPSRPSNASPRCFGPRRGRRRRRRLCVPPHAGTDCSRAQGVVLRAVLPFWSLVPKESLLVCAAINVEELASQAKPLGLFPASARPGSNRVPTAVRDECGASIHSSLASVKQIGYESKRLRYAQLCRRRRATLARHIRVVGARGTGPSSDMPRPDLPGQ